MTRTRYNDAPSEGVQIIAQLDTPTIKCSLWSDGKVTIKLLGGDGEWRRLSDRKRITHRALDPVREQLLAKAPPLIVQLYYAECQYFAAKLHLNAIKEQLCGTST